MYDFLAWDLIQLQAAYWMDNAKPILIVLFGIILAVSLIGVASRILKVDSGDIASAGSGAPLVDHRVR